MNTTITLDEAQAKLKDLVYTLGVGQEIIIMHNSQPVAKLVGGQPKERKPRRPGLGKGKIILLTEDDEHLNGFD